MPTVLIVIATAGVALLWRTYRYDSDNRFNAALDRLPYILRKPVTCGLCFTFWTAFFESFVFSPFPSLVSGLPFRIVLEEGGVSVATFLVQWLALGTCATAVVYIVDTFYEISHYLKHSVGVLHDHENHEK